MIARDFVKHMEEIINSPSQRLIGDPTTGFVYLDTDEAEDRAVVSSAVKQMLNKYSGTLIKPFIPEIKKVHFNDPVTVVFWTDNTKTIVRCGDNDIFDPEKGLAMAIAKKSLGNQGNYYNEFKKWLPDERPNDNPKPIATDYKVEQVDGGVVVCGTLTEEGVKVLAGNPYTVKEYCKLHNFTKNKVYGMIKRGEVRAEKNSKGVWIVYE